MKKKKQCLTDDEALALYERLTRGDDSARDELILKCIPLASIVTDAFLAEFPGCRHLRDDMESEGYLAIVTGVDLMQKREPIDGAKPRGYLRCRIQQAIGALVQKELSLMPDRTQRRARSRNKNVPLRLNQSDHPDIEKLMDVPQEDSRFGVIDLMDEILACCETDVERSIIGMRAEVDDGSVVVGLPDEAIGKALGLSQASVFLIRKDIYARFLERSGMKGEA